MWPDAKWSYYYHIKVDYFSITGFPVVSDPLILLSSIFQYEQSLIFFKEQHIILFYLFIVTCGWVELPWDKSVPVNTHVIAAISNHSFTSFYFYSFLKLIRQKNSACHVTKKMQSPPSWRLSCVRKLTGSPQTVRKCWYWKLLPKRPYVIQCCEKVFALTSERTFTVL